MDYRKDIIKKFQEINLLRVQHFDVLVKQSRGHRIINFAMIDVVSTDHAAHETCCGGVFCSWPPELLSEDRRRHQKDSDCDSGTGSFRGALQFHGSPVCSMHLSPQSGRWLSDDCWRANAL